ncbi:hypothetical protein [Lacticaseibacillus kribbianus]|uniref:hypothetical protein n=1 Tax=Lacticaseibacillus kribbianus TaxID=2926292 RepID=UPI001CD693FD|nr:hypothetical protein [Lacticaseibacillus kribbianus]
MGEFEANNRRVQELRGLNRMYAETLVNYLRGRWTKDQAAVEETLADLLADMIEAQAAGISAKAHFGADPQPAADAILRELPPAPGAQWLVRLWPFGNALGILLLAATLLDRGLDGVFDPRQAVQLLVMPVVFLVVAALMRGLGFNRLRRSAVIGLVAGCVLYLAAIAALILVPLPALTWNAVRLAAVGLAAVAVVANGWLARTRPALALPWLIAWLIAGPLSWWLLGQVLPDWVGFAFLAVFAFGSVLIEIHQVNRLHVLAAR